VSGGYLWNEAAQARGQRSGYTWNDRAVVTGCRQSSAHQLEWTSRVSQTVARKRREEMETYWKDRAPTETQANIMDLRAGGGLRSGRRREEHQEAGWIIRKGRWWFSAKRVMGG
jgi:hypothetical protein